jgi:hypothetical protein
MAKLNAISLSGGGQQGPKGDKGDQGVPGNGTPTNTYDILYTTNNGNGTNVKIGDDIWLGDINFANGFIVKGVGDATKATIVLGNNKTEKIATDANNLSLSANNDIILTPGSTYAYLNSVTIPNRIAKWSDTIIYRSTPPAHDHGATGDRQGTFSFDDTHLFVCTADYVNDSTVIWKRINWAVGNW